VPEKVAKGNSQKNGTEAKVKGIESWIEKTKNIAESRNSGGDKSNQESDVPKKFELGSEEIN